MDKALLRVWIDKEKVKRLHDVKLKTGLSMAFLVNKTLDKIIRDEARKHAKKVNNFLNENTMGG